MRLRCKYLFVGVLLFCVSASLVYYYSRTSYKVRYYDNKIELPPSIDVNPPTELDIDKPVLLKSSMNLCHSQNDTEFHHSKNNVIVFGASSFLGSRIVARAHSTGLKVFAVEDILNRYISHYSWYRWDRLMEHNFLPEYINASSSSEMASLLNKCKSGTIVYIPSLIFDGVSNQSKLSTKLPDLSTMLRNFISLLELLVAHYEGRFRVVLVSLSSEAGLSVQKAWLNMLEVSLSSYQGMYRLHFIVLRVNGVYGLWDGSNMQKKLRCLHVRKFEDELLAIFVTTSTKSCEVRKFEKCSEKSSDVASKTEPGAVNSKNVIMSTYFTKGENSMYTIIPNKFLFLKQWFLSARKFGAFLVIFHDELSVDFQQSVEHFYPSVEFVKLDTLHGWSANDGRFYAEYDYLLQHPEINRVLLTDLRDVKFFDDPFKPMKVIGDYIYVGIDVTYLLYSYELKWIQDIFRICSKHEDRNFMKLHPFLNAGVLGGTRHAMLSYMVQLNHYLKKTPKFNCNMAAVNFVTNKFFHDSSFSGYPIQQGFKLGTAHSKGLAVKHKDTGELDH